MADAVVFTHVLRSGFLSRFMIKAGVSDNGAIAATAGSREYDTSTCPCVCWPACKHTDKRAERENDNVGRLLLPPSLCK